MTARTPVQNAVLAALQLHPTAISTTRVRELVNAGYLLGALKGSFGWTPAAIMQISGCAMIAAILSIMAAKKK